MYKRVTLVLPDGLTKKGKVDTTISHSEIEASILKACNLPESDYTIRNFSSLELDEPVLVIDRADFNI